MKRDTLDSLINAVLRAELTYQFNFEFLTMNDLLNFYRAYGCSNFVNPLTDGQLRPAEFESPSFQGMVTQFNVTKRFRDRNDDLQTVRIKCEIEILQIKQLMETSGPQSALFPIIDALKTASQTISIIIQSEILGTDVNPHDEIYKIIESVSTTPVNSGVTKSWVK